MDANFSVVILAAGQGVRMRSALPKVLHTIGGIPILEHIISTARQLNPKAIVVVHGYEGEQLKAAIPARPGLLWAKQEKQLGTGHAALQALPYVGDVEKVLILYGDVPLISIDTLHKLSADNAHNGLSFITLNTDNPSGYGRVVRRSGKVQSIVEEKDASREEKDITEVNMGFFLSPKERLCTWLANLSAKTAQGEYYLSDIVKCATSEHLPVTAISPESAFEVLGVNDKIQLAFLERCYQSEKARQLMTQGVTLRDPNRLDIRGEMTAGQDVTIDVNVILEGQVKLGNQVYIGPNVYIKNATIHDGVQIFANSVIDGATIQSGCKIGPFARVRPKTTLAVNAHLGNFVEVKNSDVGANSKINHLSYVGDTTLGENVNIGAGVITCNFDGLHKHRTVIGNHVFVGSDAQLIAPVTLGDGVTVGAGTTVTEDVPPNHLIHNRIQHRVVANWDQNKNESPEDSE